jgi:short-subunit dehydrogenase
VAVRWRFPSKAITRYGTTALVTGASSGIGESFARRLAKEGFSTIVLVARRFDKLEALASELTSQFGVRCIPIALDLAQVGAVERLAESVSQHGCHVDLVVNNAGFGLLGALDTLPVERLTSMVDLNCRAVVEVARYFLPAMKERRRGAMIITSSIVGALPAPWFSVYCATKAFDLYFGESLHAETKGSGVDIVTVLPGLTRTEFHAGLGDREYHSPYRMPEQVVDSALSALGRKALVVDGFFNKLMVHGSRFLPRALALALSRAVMRFELRISEKSQ